MTNRLFDVSDPVALLVHSASAKAAELLDWPAHERLYYGDDLDLLNRHVEDTASWNHYQEESA